MCEDCDVSEAAGVSPSFSCRQKSFSASLLSSFSLPFSTFVCSSRCIYLQRAPSQSYYLICSALWLRLHLSKQITCSVLKINFIDFPCCSWPLSSLWFIWRFSFSLSLISVCEGNDIVQVSCRSLWRRSSRSSGWCFSADPHVNRSLWFPWSPYGCFQGRYWLTGFFSITKHENIMTIRSLQSWHWSLRGTEP